MELQFVNKLVSRATATAGTLPYTYEYHSISPSMKADPGFWEICVKSRNCLLLS